MNRKTSGGGGGDSDIDDGDSCVYWVFDMYQALY